jgi:hypothetical protein
MQIMVWGGMHVSASVCDAHLQRSTAADPCKLHSHQDAPFHSSHTASAAAAAAQDHCRAAACDRNQLLALGVVQQSEQPLANVLQAAAQQKCRNIHSRAELG